MFAVPTVVPRFCGISVGVGGIVRRGASSGLRASPLATRLEGASCRGIYTETTAEHWRSGYTTAVFPLAMCMRDRWNAGLFWNTLWGSGGAW